MFAIPEAPVNERISWAFGVFVIVEVE